VGRPASWPRQLGLRSYTYTPNNSSDQGNFTAWNLGPAAPVGLTPTPFEWYNPSQFPTDNEQAWLDATRSRYLEFDLGSNIALQTDAAAVAADSGKARRPDRGTSPTPRVDFAPW
jgi:hypothetical protein